MPINQLLELARLELILPAPCGRDAFEEYDRNWSTQYTLSIAGTESKARGGPPHPMANAKNVSPPKMLRHAICPHAYMYKRVRACVRVSQCI